MRVPHLFISAGICLLSLSALSQNHLTTGEIAGKPWVGPRGISEPVSLIMLHAGEAESPARSTPEVERELIVPDRSVLPQNLDAPFASNSPVRTQKTSRLPSIPDPLSPQTIGVDFEGVSSRERHVFPADCAGAIGPTQFLLCTNSFVRTFTKSGIPDGVLSLPIDTFFNAVRGGQFSGNPHVLFDRLSQRWFIMAAAFNATSSAERLMIAISSGAAIASSSNFTFFEFRHDSVGGFPNPDSSYLADSPTLGVDANALYIGANIFGPPNAPTFKGSTVFIVRKSSLLSGGPIVATAFRLPYAVYGAILFTPQGSTNDDPGATEGYFIAVDKGHYGLLNVRRITDPGGTPTMSGNLTITVPATSSPANVPNKGGTLLLSAFDERLEAATMKNGRLWISHHISVDSNGVAFTGSGARDGVRFYEITNLTGTPTLHQSGTLYDSLATGPRWYWISSIAMSGQGHVAIGCSYSGTGDYAGVAYAGRLSGDPLGTVRAPTLYPSSYAYNPSFDPTSPRYWGFYSTTSVDPIDNMTIWTVQEYCDSTNNWGVRITQLKAPPPATPSLASPDSVQEGTAHVDVSITGTMSSGRGFYDPGPSFPHRISASISGSGVTVNSITFTDSIHITLNISVDSTAALGGRTITVVNPDSQSATSVSGILTIRPLPTASIHIPIAGSWNLVSNPVTAANDSTRILFPGASSPAIAYVPGFGYQISDRMTNGNGYWIRYLSPESTTVTGAPIVADSIFVSGGWNLVGSITSPIPVTAITSTPPGIVTSRFFGYSGSYKTSDTIFPGQGYWVKVSQAGTFRWRTPGGALPATRIRIVSTADLPPAPPDPAISGLAISLPKEFALEQNYPNPFNPSTVIRFALPLPSIATLRVYDVLGEEVSTLVNGVEHAGFKSVEWNAAGFSSGVYFYRLEATGLANPKISFRQVRKLLLVK